MHLETTVEGIATETVELTAEVIVELIAEVTVNGAAHDHPATEARAMTTTLTRTLLVEAIERGRGKTATVVATGGAESAIGTVTEVPMNAAIQEICRRDVTEMVSTTGEAEDAEMTTSSPASGTARVLRRLANQKSPHLT